MIKPSQAAIQDLVVCVRTPPTCARSARIMYIISCGSYVLQAPLIRHKALWLLPGIMADCPCRGCSAALSLHNFPAPP